MRTIERLFAAALCLGASAPAQAQELAPQIQQDVEAALASFAGPDGQATLTHGDVAVAVDGTAYVVTIADVRGLPDEAGYLEIGAVSFRMTPQGGDLYRLDEVRLPTEFPYRTADGGTDGGVALASQQFTGVWSRSLKSFLQLDAGYRDVEITRSTDGMSMTLGEMTANLDSVEKASGRFDQDGAIRIANLHLSDPEMTLSLGAVDVTSSARDYNVKGWAAVQSRIDGMTADADPDAPVPAIDPQLFEALRGAAPLISGGVTNVHVSAVDLRDPGGAELLSLADGAVNVALEGFDQAIGRIVLSLGHRGLAVGDVEPAARDLIPHELSINVALENLPVQEIWNGTIDTFAGSDMSTDEGSSMAMFMLMGLLQQSLQSGKSRMALNDWRIVTALAEAQLGGVIEASAESMFGAVGQLTLDVTGLDRFIDSVRTNFGPQSDEAVQLEVLRGFSSRQTAADGAVVDHYDIRFTPEGQFLINGKEYSFMGPMGGHMPPEDGSMDDDGAGPDAATPPSSEGSGETTTGN